jgi:hypothetical protein
MGAYTLHGRQLNGLSQAVSYGDDAAMATNYPIVRIRHVATGHIRYCRTFDHSSMGVGTGTAIHSTQFIVPIGIDLGHAELTVVANGIASEPVSVFVLPFHFPLPLNTEFVTTLIGSLADGPLWALGRNGPVPVDPSAPDLAKQATEARSMLITGLKLLQQVGQNVNERQLTAAARVAPEVDPDLKRAD